jgi:hypothetical protein
MGLANVEPCGGRVHAAGDEGSGVPQPISGRIAVVGICAAGKTALVDALRARGYDARSCAQEHAFVPDMWQRLSRPQVMVYLDASLDAIRRRRRIDYGAGYVQEQRRRLAHARSHCQIYLHTDELSLTEVFDQIIRYLDALGVSPKREAP